MSPNFKLFLVAMVLLTGALLNGCDAGAQPPTDVLTWVHPTQREDGTALALSEIDATLINWGPSGGPYTQGSQTVNAPATTASVPRPNVAGNRCYIAFTRDTQARISAPTAQVCLAVVAPPKSPTGFTVQ
jgi:hypothetical protein